MDYTSFNLFSLVSYQIILDMITVLVAEMSFVADVPWSLFFSLCFFLASFTLSLNYSLTPINYIKIHLFIYLIFLIYLTFGWNFALVSLKRTTVVKEYCCVYLSLSLHNLSPWWFRHTSAPSRTGNTWLSLLILPLLLIPKCRHPLWFMWVYLQTQPRLALKFTGVQLSWGLKHIWIWWDFSEKIELVESDWLTKYCCTKETHDTIKTRFWTAHSYLYWCVIRICVHSQSWLYSHL